MQRAEIIVKGRVQGVFFRMFVKERAIQLNLTGWVKNKDSDKVHILAEGDEQAIKQLISLARQGPPSADVQDVKISYSTPTKEFKYFSVKY